MQSQVLIDPVKILLCNSLYLQYIGMWLSSQLQYIRFKQRVIRFCLQIPLPQLCLIACSE